MKTDESLLKSGYFANFILLTRIAIGVILIFSGFMKFWDIGSFIISLGKFRMMGDSSVRLFAYIIPSVEVLLGLALLFKYKLYLTSQLTTFLFCLFTAVITSKIAEGEEISCGCFGNLSDGKIDSVTILRNVILIILGTVLTAYYSMSENSDSGAVSKKLAGFKDAKYYASLKSAFFVLIFFFLGVQTVVFSVQNKQLKYRLSLLLLDKDVLQEGEAVSSFQAKDLNGNNTEIKFANMEKKKSLLFLLSLECNSCKMNLPNWVNLKNSVRNRPVRIYTVAMDSLRNTINYKKANRVNLDIYSVPEDDFKVKYKGFITPQTILIDEKGNVIRSWAGVLNEIKINQIMKSL